MDLDHSDYLILVIEVGGSSLRAARFDPHTLRLTDRRQRPVRHAEGEPPPDHQSVFDMLAELGSEVLGGRDPDAVALAYPGPIDADGTVLATPTLLGGGYAPFDLRSACRGCWPSASLLLLNDVTAAGYRYLAAGQRDFCILTIGSGIGNKIFLDGEPYVGPGARGGELGHLRMDFAPDALPCECGGRGHLGAMASGRGTLAIVRRLAERDSEGFGQSLLAPRGPTGVDTSDIAAAYRSGDPWTERALEEPSRYLGWALAAVHLALGIERFILIGGFVLALGETYRRAIATAAASAAWSLAEDWDAMVRLGEPDDDQGLIGCGLAAARARP